MEIIEEKPYDDFDREFKIAKPTTKSETHTDTKYVGDKKITTTTTKTESGGPREKKVTTTTITEEVGGEPIYRTKYVKDIPIRSYGISQFDNPKNDFEKEMRELEKNFEREDEIDMPPGAISVEVKQKTVTDSRGRPFLLYIKLSLMKMAKRKLSLRKRILLNNKKVKKLKSKKVIKVGYFYYILLMKFHI